jgi:hypothetical protein
VVLEDHVRRGRELEAAAVDAHAARAQALDLLEELERVDGDAVADHVDLARVQDAGRDQVQDVFLAPHHDRVPGVGAALVAHDHVGVARHPVDQLALALVAHWAPKTLVMGMLALGPDRGDAGASGTSAGPGILARPAAGNKQKRARRGARSGPFSVRLRGSPGPRAGRCPASPSARAA